MAARRSIRRSIRTPSRISPPRWAACTATWAPKADQDRRGADENVGGAARREVARREVRARHRVTKAVQMSFGNSKRDDVVAGAIFFAIGAASLLYAVTQLAVGSAVRDGGRLFSAGAFGRPGAGRRRHRGPWLSGVGADRARGRSPPRALARHRPRSPSARSCSRSRSSASACSRRSRCSASSRARQPAVQTRAARPSWSLRSPRSASRSSSTGSTFRYALFGPGWTRALMDLLAQPRAWPLVPRSRCENLLYCLLGSLLGTGDRRAARPRPARDDRDAAADHLRADADRRR